MAQECTEILECTLEVDVVFPQRVVCVDDELLAHSGRLRSAGTAIERNRPLGFGSSPQSLQVLGQKFRELFQPVRFRLHSEHELPELQVTNAECELEAELRIGGLRGGEALGPL
jgi:hypothetical protein